MKTSLPKVYKQAIKLQNYKKELALQKQIKLIFNQKDNSQDIYINDLENRIAKTSFGLKCQGIEV